ncbi:Flp pilus assembly protein TadG [Variovorax boronicumulans]|uniref:Flp pilus assembly protein TadG n=1 Tax=Variovorax boronicumulans TaxID=436515 RepID=A0AAW8E8R6_9BURK|nr:TadE/TadG family type IV pilus assembly protein [Variovorax boronicumulans]MDP9882418.1 Flp pilus assembly protein TadG [Variovorax boronicumulans]MDP9927734.1 Flp pilus assembly protein TadG [Variovorax boronicumulans]
MSAHLLRRPARELQRGIAAIEFALVLSTLMLVLYGLVSFGAVLYAQQAISRAAEDGARAFAGVNDPTETANIALIRNIVYASLATSLVTPANVGNSTAQRKTWLQTNPNVSVTVATSGLVTVSYPYRENPIIALPAVLTPSKISGSAKFSM